MKREEIKLGMLVRVIPAKIGWKRPLGIVVKIGEPAHLATEDYAFVHFSNGEQTNCSIKWLEKVK